MYDIIIIGCGPAGMTAAIYACRAGMNVLIIEGEGIGGQISYSPKVENFPAFPALSGAEFAEKMYDQVESFGAQAEIDTVTAVKKNGEGFTVFTEDNTFECKSVIIATGLKHSKLGVEGEDELIGNGISYCAMCDGDFYRDRVVAVVGGGNSALQEAIYLSSICSKVYLIHRRDEFRADKALVDQAESIDNIIFELCYTVDGFICDDGVLKSVKLKGTKGNADKTTDVSGIFAAVGKLPQNEIFAGLIELDEKGYIKADESCKTNIDGIFVCGDCRTKQIRQLTTAASDGAIAGSAAAEWARKH